jgi:glycosyltransferase involved in cell wall biosynthesis
MHKNGKERSDEMKRVGSVSPGVDEPMVSIITPTYNSIDYIADTLQSVAGQEYKNWEHIIIDDASTDATQSVVDACAKRDNRIRFIKLPINSGAAVARNTGIRAARGRYIAFLDADDLWLPHKLARQLAFMRETGAAFAYASFDLIDESGLGIGRVEVPQTATYTSLLRNNVIGCLTAMYDTEKTGKIEMPLIRKRQDLGLWLRILKKIPEARGVSEVLGQYRIRPGSISSNKLRAARHTWHLYRHVEGLPLAKAVYYFACYAMNGIRKGRRNTLVRS